VKNLLMFLRVTLLLCVTVAQADESDDPLFLYHLHSIDHKFQAAESLAGKVVAGKVTEDMVIRDFVTVHRAPGDPAQDKQDLIMGHLAVQEIYLRAVLFMPPASKDLEEYDTLLRIKYARFLGGFYTLSYLCKRASTDPHRGELESRICEYLGDLGVKMMPQ
jgi:hypothetical protein